MTIRQAVRVNVTTPAATSESGSDLNSDIDERFREEMERLASVNKEILQGVRQKTAAPGQESEDAEEIATLRAANAELRERVEELERFLSSSVKAEDGWLEQQKEYEALLEEKSEVIRALHRKLQEAEESQKKQAEPPPSVPLSGQAIQDQGALKQSLTEQRRQLEEDEKELMTQMRQMEMAMSRDRAELARQRSEIERLHAELTREIEMASRDPSLREKLLNLQRRQQAMSTSTKPANGVQSQANSTQPANVEKKPSGLLRRIFGK